MRFFRIALAAVLAFLLGPSIHSKVRTWILDLEARGVSHITRGSTGNRSMWPELSREEEEVGRSVQSLVATFHLKDGSVLVGRQEDSQGATWIGKEFTDEISEVQSPEELEGDISISPDTANTNFGAVAGSGLVTRQEEEKWIAENVHSKSDLDNVVNGSYVMDSHALSKGNITLAGPPSHIPHIPTTLNATPPPGVELSITTGSEESLPPFNPSGEENLNSDDLQEDQNGHQSIVSSSKMGDSTLHCQNQTFISKLYDLSRSIILGIDHLCDTIIPFGVYRDAHAVFQELVSLVYRARNSIVRRFQTVLGDIHDDVLAVFEDVTIAVVGLKTYASEQCRAMFYIFVRVFASVGDLIKHIYENIKWYCDITAAVTLILGVVFGGRSVLPSSRSAASIVRVIIQTPIYGIRRVLGAFVNIFKLALCVSLLYWLPTAFATISVVMTDGFYADDTQPATVPLNSDNDELPEFDLGKTNEATTPPKVEPRIIARTEDNAANETLPQAPQSPQIARGLGDRSHLEVPPYLVESPEQNHESTSALPNPPKPTPIAARPLPPPTAPVTSFPRTGRGFSTYKYDGTVTKCPSIQPTALATPAVAVSATRPRHPFDIVSSAMASNDSPFHPSPSPKGNETGLHAASCRRSTETIRQESPPLEASVTASDDNKSGDRGLKLTRDPRVLAMAEGRVREARFAQPPPRIEETSFVKAANPAGFKKGSHQTWPLKTYQPIVSQPIKSPITLVSFLAPDIGPTLPPVSPSSAPASQPDEPPGRGLAAETQSNPKDTQVKTSVTISPSPPERGFTCLADDPPIEQGVLETAGNSKIQKRTVLADDEVHAPTAPEVNKVKMATSTSNVIPVSGYVSVAGPPTVFQGVVKTTCDSKNEQQAVVLNIKIPTSIALDVKDIFTADVSHALAPHGTTLALQLPVLELKIEGSAQGLPMVPVLATLDESLELSGNVNFTNALEENQGECLDSESEHEALTAESELPMKKKKKSGKNRTKQERKIAKRKKEQQVAEEAAAAATAAGPIAPKAGSASSAEKYHKLVRSHLGLPNADGPAKPMRRQ